jgi:hypothetical protein
LWVDIGRERWIVTLLYLHAEGVEIHFFPIEWWL